MLTGGRAVVTEAAIRKWFHDIQAYIVEEEDAADLLQAPEQIFNFDESNFLLARKKGNVLGPVNYKSFLQTSNENDKEGYSTDELFCCRENGTSYDNICIQAAHSP